MTYPPQPPDESGSQPDHTPYQPPPQYGAPRPPTGPEPQYGQPPQYSQLPHYGQQPPQYGAPPTYGPPQAYGDPQQWAPPVQPPSGAEQPYSLMPPPAQQRHRGRMFATIAAVAVLAAGGVATYVAVSQSSSDHGAASPREAVQQIVSDLNSSDVVGMLDSLAPPERVAIADPLIKDFNELKRTHVLSSDADLSHLSGAAAKFSALTYGSDIAVNDHVAVVQITGGTLHVGGDLSKLPFSSDFLKAIGVKNGLSGSRSQTVNIADAVRSNHGESIRVATEKVDGRWYPSLLYTIAYYAVDSSGLPQPKPNEAVPAVGADSPVDAVHSLVTALLGGDIPGAIGLLSPSEDAALHDYGGVILNQVGSSYPAAPIALNRLELHSKSGPNGTQLVVLDGFSATVKGLGQVNLEIDGDCMRLTIRGQTKRLCVAQEMQQLEQLFNQFAGKPLTAAQKQALQDVSGATNLDGGIVTSQAGGKWYVNPIQTFLDGTTSLLEQFKDNDLLELIGLFKELASASVFGSSSGSGGSFCVPAPGQTC